MSKLLIIGYLLLFFGWRFTKRYYTDETWIITLFDIGSVYICLFSIPLILLAWKKKLPILRWIILLPLLLFFSLFGDFFVPNFTEYPEQADVRVMTYNILNLNNSWDELEGNIRRYDADFVAIQELVPAAEENLLPMLTDLYPHVAIASPIRGGTVAVLSKTPFQSTMQLNFGVDRPAMVVESEIDGQPIVFVSAHLNPIYYAIHDVLWKELPASITQFIKDQNFQAMQLTQYLQQYDKIPIIVGCDCNSYETSSSNSILTYSFINTSREMGWRWSTPLEGTSFERKIRHIDYVWYRGNLTAYGIYRVQDSGGSDHQPLVAEYGWRE